MLAVSAFCLIFLLFFVDSRLVWWFFVQFFSRVCKRQLQPGRLLHMPQHHIAKQHYATWRLVCVVCACSCCEWLLCVSCWRVCVLELLTLLFEFAVFHVCLNSPASLSVCNPSATTAEDVCKASTPVTPTKQCQDVVRLLVLASSPPFAIPLSISRALSIRPPTFCLFFSSLPFLGLNFHLRKDVENQNAFVCISLVVYSDLRLQLERHLRVLGSV